ncbi:MAG: hypothetical protein EOO00_10575 [Chitinophagaceae bacterium]|nr:MAG: hypothetical protein EOO00_10575 [Chitinophagaceae bacterium]
MLYLLWALINIGLCISFIIICVKATKLIREKLGWIAVFVFVFGILSYIAGDRDNEDDPVSDSSRFKTWELSKEDSLAIASKAFLTTPLHKTLMSKYILGVEYGKGTQPGLYIPIRANSWTTGFINGTKWKPVSILVNPTADNRKFEYEVLGTIKWRLLGFTVYHQSKSWKGQFLIQ